MKNMKVNYAGIELEHPILAASTGATRDWQQAVKCEESGYSGVVLKSIQEEEIMRYNPFPRFKVIRSGIPGFSSTTFYSYEQAYHGDMDDYYETVYQSKKRCSIPIIASINCINPEIWGEYAAACEQAGADAIEIVPSCPSGLLVRDPSNDNHSISVAALKLCKEKVKIPVIPKMTAQVANPLYTAMCLDEAGADGLTMNNRVTGIDIDVNTMAPVLHGGVAGHGGSWALNTILRWIIVTYPKIKGTISATGGATNGEEVIKCLLAGANSVQVGAVMYLKGYDYVKTMLAQVEEYMDRMGIDKLSDIIGKASERMLTMEEYDRSTRYFAQPDLAKCKKCGQCKPVCIYDALTYTENGPQIDPDKCDGCGLCASVCRNDVIEMKKKG